MRQPSSVPVLWLASSLTSGSASEMTLSMLRCRTVSSWLRRRIARSCSSVHIARDRNLLRIGFRISGGALGVRLGTRDAPDLPWAKGPSDGVRNPLNQDGHWFREFAKLTSDTEDSDIRLTIPSIALHARGLHAP